MNIIKVIWELLKGKKTYVAAVAAIIYGLIQSETEMVLAGLGLLGMRHGLSTELTKVIEELKK